MRAVLSVSLGVGEAVLELLLSLLDLSGRFWPCHQPPREQLTVLGDIHPPRAHRT